MAQFQLTLISTVGSLHIGHFFRIRVLFQPVIHVVLCTVKKPLQISWLIIFLDTGKDLRIALVSKKKGIKNLENDRFFNVRT
jgi:hypothetical protein